MSRSPFSPIPARVPALRPAGDAMPSWARDSYSESQWNALGEAGQRDAGAQHAREAASDDAMMRAIGGVFDTARGIIAQIQAGDLQRGLASLAARATMNTATVAADADRFLATTNRHAAELNFALAQARATGNAAEAAQARAALAALTDAQQRTQQLLVDLAARASTPPALSSGGVPTLAVVAGFGALAVAGAWFIRRRHP